MIRLEQRSEPRFQPWPVPGLCERISGHSRQSGISVDGRIPCRHQPCPWRLSKSVATYRPSSPVWATSRGSRQAAGHLNPLRRPAGRIAFGIAGVARDRPV